MNQTRIDVEILIIGNGEYLKNGSVVYENNKIIYAGEIEHAPQIENTTQTKTIMIIFVLTFSCIIRKRVLHVLQPYI